MSIVTGIVVAAAILALAAGGFALVRSMTFDGEIEDMRARMIAAQANEGRVAELPVIVRDFATRSGGTVEGPAVFHLRHRASLVTAKGQAPLAIVADQWVGTRVPGLVWKARGSMMGLPVTVLDSYVDGAGRLEARVLGAVQVAGGQGSEFDRGEFMRYLSELPVHPDAILNTAGLVWRQLDETTVEVSAGIGAANATLRFLFDDNGDIVGMEADDRPMIVGGKTVSTPWRGSYSRYTQFGPYRIPAYGEVGWILPDGFFTYWMGEVVAYEPLQ